MYIYKAPFFIGNPHFRCHMTSYDIIIMMSYYDIGIYRVNVSMVASFRLTIRNVKFKDEGEYTCFPDEQNVHKTSEQKVTRSIHLHVERGKNGDGLKDNSGAEDDHDDDDHDAPAGENDPIVPFFTNFSTMHDTIAKAAGDSCTFFCHSYGEKKKVLLKGHALVVYGRSCEYNIILNNGSSERSVDTLKK